MPSLRWSDPPRSTPRASSMKIAWHPPRGSGAQLVRWPTLEVLARGSVDRRLERQGALDIEGSRPVRCLLRIIAAIEHLRKDMRMACRLELPAHDAERHHRAPVAAQ